MAMRRVIEEFEGLPPKLRARMVARSEEGSSPAMQYAFSALGDFMSRMINSGLEPQEAVDLLSVYRHTTIDLAEQLGHELESDE